MIDLEQRLRKTFSALAGDEALSDARDEEAAAELLKWAEELAEHFVRQTGDMEDDAAEEYLSPYLRALRTMMRAIAHWMYPTGTSTHLEWWNRIEPNAKVLYGEQLQLPSLKEFTGEIPLGSTPQEVVALLRKLMYDQGLKG